MRQITQSEFVDAIVQVNKKSLFGRKMSKGEEYFLRDGLRGNFEIFMKLGWKIMKASDVKEKASK